MIDLSRVSPEDEAELEQMISALPAEERAAVAHLIQETMDFGRPLSIDYLRPALRLRDFVREAWPMVEPSTYIHNWHIDAMCEHLEAVSSGQIRNLLLNVPPRHSKSLIVSVMWPAWTWTFKPSVKWLFSSYAESLSTEHSVSCRNLIQSTWYRHRWGHMFRLVGDQNQKTRYNNSKMGYRLSTSVGSSATGFGGDILCCDDPNNIKTVESETARKEVTFWWDQVMSTRLNNAISGARVVIQQRGHEEDLSGHILKKEPGVWVHLKLPTEFDPSRRCSTSIGWSDPRTTMNELLNPLRFGATEVDKAKTTLGSYGFAGQHQQEPAPSGGGIFKRAWFRIVQTTPRKVDRRLRFWDAAGTEAEQNPDAAFTVGLKMAKADGIFYIEHVVRGQWSAHDVDLNMKSTAEADGKNVRQKEEQEGGSAGKYVVRAHSKLLSGFDYHFETPTGSKLMRARPFAAQAEAGNVCIVSGDWNEKYLDEVSIFPNSTIKDQVDASSGAFNEIEFGDWAGSGGVF